MSIMNTYVGGTKSYGGGKTVWYSIDEKYPVGGTIDISTYKKGDLIPAGSMVAISTLGGKAEIVKKEDKEKLEKVVGLTESDIYVPENMIAMTTAIVTKGQVEASFIPEVPMAVRAKLFGISFVDRFEQKEEIGG